MRFTEYNQSLPDGVQSTTRSLFTTPSKLTSGRGARQRTVPLPATTSGSPDRTTCFKAKHSIISGKAARCRRLPACSRRRWCARARGRVRRENAARSHRQACRTVEGASSRSSHGEAGGQRQHGWPHVRTPLLPLQPVVVVALACRYTAVRCRQGAFTDSPFSDWLDLTSLRRSQPRGFKLVACIICS